MITVYFSAVIFIICCTKLYLLLKGTKRRLIRRYFYFEHFEIVSADEGPKKFRIMQNYASLLLLLLAALWFLVPYLPKR